MNSEYKNSGINSIELRILKLLTGGLTDTEISQEIGSTPGYIRSHIKSILDKLGARNRIEAVTIAFYRGILSVDTDPKTEHQRNSLSPHEFWPFIIAHPDTASSAWHNLTKREWVIFMLMGDEETTGLTNKALARRLCITEGTLKKHLQRIYKKLGVINRSGAALLAAEAKHFENQVV
jgi:DNA-binding NarL/FixJ family response regulator